MDGFHQCFEMVRGVVFLNGPKSYANGGFRVMLLDQGWGNLNLGAGNLIQVGINLTRGGDNLNQEGRKEMFYLTTHSTHMVKDHSDSEREETRCCHIGYSFQLAARVILYASYHSLCYTSCGALAGMRNSSMGPP